MLPQLDLANRALWTGVGIICLLVFAWVMSGCTAPQKALDGLDRADRAAGLCFEEEHQQAIQQGLLAANAELQAAVTAKDGKRAGQVLLTYTEWMQTRERNARAYDAAENYRIGTARQYIVSTLPIWTKVQSQLWPATQPAR